MNCRSLILTGAALGASLMLLFSGCQQQDVNPETKKITQKNNFVQHPVTPAPRPTPDKKIIATGKQMRDISDKFEALSQEQRKKAYPEAAVPAPVVRVDFANGQMFLDGKLIDHPKYVEKRIRDLAKQQPVLAVIADEKGDYYNTIMTLLGYCKTHRVSDIRFGGEMFQDVVWNKTKP
jgi:hypothetical protein